MSLSRQRQTANIRNANKTTTVVFTPANIKVQDEELFERLTIYVVPDQFTSFIKLNKVGANYRYNLNDDLTYKVVAIAWKNDEFHTYTGALSDGDKSIDLQSTNEDDWMKMVDRDFPSIIDFNEEIELQSLLKKDQKRQNRNQAKRDLRNKIRPYIFDCDCYDEQTNIIVTDSTSWHSSNSKH
jgi:hypothetical protein